MPVLDTGAMGTRPRGLREQVVRAMAKVGLVWAVAVLAVVFMAMGSQGQDSDGGYALSGAAADQATSLAVPGDAPSTAGLALALVVLAGGVTVLAIGAARGDREPSGLRYADEPDHTPDLPLALGLGLLA